MKGVLPGLVFLLSFSACGSSNNGQHSQPKSEGPSETVSSTSIAGDYQCKIKIEENESEAPCRVASTAEGLAFEMAQGLNGAVEPDATGFALRGQIRCKGPQSCNEKVELQFYTQGNQVFAATFALADGRLVDVLLNAQ